MNWDTTENLYIEGDNLEVLKLLQESYLGKVKMIYIDPPYNTGNDFIYRDSFSQTEEEYADELGQYDEDENRLFKNTDSNGRFHSDWCSMIYSRLMLARNLLSDDGVIFISIDDNELDSVIKIGKEVFGDDSFVASFIWEKRKTRENRKNVSIRHDYVLCFVKLFSMRNEAIGIEEMTNEAKERYKNPDNDPRGEWTSVPAIAQAGHGTKSQFYTLIAPNGREHNPPSGSCWRYTEEKMKEAIADNRVWFGFDGNNVPRIKKFLCEGKQGLTPETMLFADDVGTNDSAKRELVSLFDSIAVFETPKPVSLLRHLVQLGSQKDDIVMDFFGGTATTAHAVMKLNAEDNGKRKYIMIQLPEVTDEQSEAYKAGYTNICEIGKERIRRAAKKIAEEHPDAKFDGGFRVFKLDESNMKDVYYSPAEMDQEMLPGLESNIKEDRTDLDLLFGCILEWGLPLSMSYSSEEIDGYMVHTYNDGDLMVCFDMGISERAIKAIAERKPLRAVFRDSCFTSSPEKINVAEIFKRISPDTSVRVL